MTEAKYKIGQEVSYNYYSGIFRTGIILKIITREILSETKLEISYTYDVKYGSERHDSQHVREENILATDPLTVALVVEANEFMQELVKKYNRLKDACNKTLNYPSTKQAVLKRLLKDLKSD